MPRSWRRKSSLSSLFFERPPSRGLLSLAGLYNLYGAVTVASVRSRQVRKGCVVVGRGRSAGRLVVIGGADFDCRRIAAIDGNDRRSAGFGGPSRWGSGPASHNRCSARGCFPVPDVGELLRGHSVPVMFSVCWIAFAGTDVHCS